MLGRILSAFFGRKPPLELDLVRAALARGLCPYCGRHLLTTHWNRRTCWGCGFYHTTRLPRPEIN